MILGFTLKGVLGHLLKQNSPKMVTPSRSEILIAADFN